MRYNSSTLAAFVLGGMLLASSQNIQAQTTYIGQAVAVKANVLGIVNVSVSDTGHLPANGGSLATSLLDFTVPPTLDLHLLTANTVGENEQTNSQATVVNVTLNVAGIYITASVLNSSAQAACFADHAEISGSSTLVALKVNGLSVRVTGRPNQTIPLLVGSLVINEQIGHVTSPPNVISGDMIVNALHLKLDPIADVVISDSHAGVVCGPQGIIG